MHGGNPQDIGKKRSPSDREGEPSQHKTERSSQVAVSVIDVPESVLEEYRANQKEERREFCRNYYLTFLAVLGAWLYAGIAAFQYCAMRAANKNATETFQTSERAYVTFGSKIGTLAEFGKHIKGGKPTVILHFFNAGRTTARHLSIHAYSNRASNVSMGHHRHRFSSRYGVTMIQGSGNELDLAAQAEHVEYLTEPKFLITQKELSDPKEIFNVFGEIEYCDIFGAYHCSAFSAQYKPFPISNFVGSVKMGCIVEKPDERMLHGIENYKPVTFTEIKPCEQPNEPEYYRIADLPTPPKTAQTPPR